MVIMVLHTCHATSMEDEKKNVKTLSTFTKFYCRGFEDNPGTLELESAPKFQLHTKHINGINNHFEEYTRNKKMFVPIKTSNEVMDISRKHY